MAWGWLHPLNRLVGFAFAYCTRVNIKDDAGHIDLKKYGDIVCHVSQQR